MTPVQFKMVDLGGIDLVEIDGTAVPGIYNKILGAYNTCRVAILCNWFFAGILLPPAHVLITMDDDVLMINDVISVESDDVLSIPGLTPSVVIEELTVTENDTYTPGPGVNGFSPVIVDVPGPVLVQLTATENETYLPGTGEDGFSSVVVNVPAPAPVTVPLSVTENGTYTPEQGVDGFSQVNVNVADITISPVHVGINNGYVYQGWFINTPSPDIRSDVFSVESGKTYVVALGSNVGNRFRVAFFTSDPINFTTDVQGVQIGTDVSDPPIASSKPAYTAPSNGYLMVMTTNTAQTGIHLGVIELNKI